MPKTKTMKAAKKRFKLTGTGKVLYQRAGVRHNLEKVSGKDHRSRFAKAELAPELVPTVKRLLGKR
jgi:large subunit ribosomal protein L35